MLNPFRFLRKFFSIMGDLSLVLLLLFGAFVGLAMLVYVSEAGRNFSNAPADLAESFYFSAVTALTIGYGDIVPHSPLGRCASLLLALLGITLTGIVAAAAVRALEDQFAEQRRRKPPGL